MQTFTERYQNLSWSLLLIESWNLMYENGFQCKYCRSCHMYCQNINYVIETSKYYANIAIYRFQTT